MAPTQPSSVQSVIGSEEFFRIRQPVTSPGDRYEVDVSTRSIFLGPDSDVSEVGILYLDNQAPRSMNDAAISAGGPFVNRLDALMDQVYPGIGQPGRILAYPVDVVDPAYVRVAQTVPETPIRRYNLVPYIDLICALKQLPVIPQVRPDKTYRLKVPMNHAPTDEDTDNGSTDLVIPIYGRRMVSVQTITPLATPHITNVFLAALPAGGTSVAAKDLGAFTTINSALIVQTETAVFRASDQTDGTAAGGSDVPTTFTWQTNFPLTACKGMGDLLIVNFQPNFGGTPPPGYSMLDVIIRVSDREV